jgi:hypothetical protein
MPDDFDLGDPSVVKEEIERRNEPRGLLHGIEVRFPDGTVNRADEASSKGVFVELADPDSHPLGAIFEVRIRGRRAGAPAEVGCRVEVIRKEIHPRRGLALRILRISAIDEKVYFEMIETV